MKCLATLLLLGMSTVGFAQMTAPTTDAGAKVLESIKALDAGAASITAGQKDLEGDAHMWAVGRNILTKNIKDANNDLDVQRLDAQKQHEYTSQLNAMTAAFNGRCDRQFESTETGAYNACVSEKSQLEPMIAKATDWQQSVDRFAEAVTQKIAKNEADRKVVNEMQEGIKARLVENESAGQQYLSQRKILVMQYQALSHGQSRCAELLKTPNVDDETLKAGCNMLFDGNNMQGGVLVQVAGIPYPVWKPWNDNDSRWHVDPQ